MKICFSESIHSFLNSSFYSYPPEGIFDANAYKHLPYLTIYVLVLYYLRLQLTVHELELKCQNSIRKFKK